MKVLAILFWLPLFCSIAAADILFLDLNGNPQEVVAAQAAAEKRGEKLIVLASKPVETTIKVKQLQDQMHVLDTQLEAKNISESQRKKLENELKSVHTEADQLIGEKYNVEKLHADLKKISASGVSVTSLVISGHDGSGAFAGVNGDVTADEMQKAFEENPQVASGIRTILLAGCNTANLGTIEKNWKSITPNAKLIAGYDGTSPLGNLPSSSRYIFEILVKEKKLIEASDAESLQKAFDDIKGLTKNASFCTNNFIVSKSGVRDIGAIKAECEPLIKSKKPDYWMSRVQCYQRGDKGCESVPSNTSSSELRTIYNELQTNSHCLEIFMSRGMPAPFPEQVLRLIFAKQVARNAENIHKSELEEFNSVLKKMGAPEDSLLNGISLLNRQELNQRLAKANDFLESKSRNLELIGGPQGEEIVKQKMRLSQFKSLLGDVNYNCSPFTWVEPNATKKSTCISDDPRTVVANRYQNYFVAFHAKKNDSVANFKKDHPTATEGELIKVGEKYTIDLADTEKKRLVGVKDIKDSLDELIQIANGSKREK